jgi:hypothetical protein
MAVHHLQAQVAIPRDSGIPADVSINTWHFAWEDTTSPFLTPTLAGQEVVQRLTTFYQAIDNILSTRNDNPVLVRVYDQGLPIPRVPIHLGAMTLTYAASALPSELAMVLSFNSEIVSGDVAARRRGRVFLGPLGDVSTAAVADQQIADSVRADVATAAGTLLGNNTSEPGLVWSQYSPTDDTLLPVVGGHIDNAFDVVRSRGMRATARTTFV